MRQSNQLSFEKQDCERLYQGFFNLNRYTFRCELFAGGWSESFTREIFERGHAAAVLLFDPVEETVVMVEQFRPGAVETQDSPWLLEPVAGIIEPGEQAQQVVMREAVEEAGIVIARLRLIHEYLVSPGGSTERIWLYIGEIDSREAPKAGGLVEEHEDIKVHCIDAEQAFSMLAEGRINNAMSIIALQWLQLHWQQRSSIWGENVTLPAK